MLGSGIQESIGGGIASYDHTWRNHGNWNLSESARAPCMNLLLISFSLICHSRNPSLGFAISCLAIYHCGFGVMEVSPVMSLAKRFRLIVETRSGQPCTYSSCTS